MNHHHPLTIALLLGVTSLCAACSTRTTIVTRPDSATVVMEDGRVLGKTPILLIDRPWAWTDHTLTFTREGYEPKTVRLDSSINPAGLAACGIGICFMWMLWPICLIGDYEFDEYVVTLKERSGLDAFDDTYEPDAKLSPDDLYERAVLNEDAPLITFSATSR